MLGANTKLRRTIFSLDKIFNFYIQSIHCSHQGCKFSDFSLMSDFFHLDTSGNYF